MENVRARFFAKIAADPSSDCILWTGARRPTGYGVVSVAGKLRQATHVSWFLKYGVWPSQQMLHRCDNPPCVNPEHLFEGTPADNVVDRDAKGRHWVLCGEEASGAKLTDLEVSEIIALTETSMTGREIGALFGVTAAYVSMLRHGRCRVTSQGLPHKTHGRPRKPKGARRFEVGGRMLTVLEIATEAGLNCETVRGRLARGLSGDDLIAPPHKAPRKPNRGWYSQQK